MSKSNLRKLFEAPPPKIEEILAEKKAQASNAALIDSIPMLSNVKSVGSNKHTTASSKTGNVRRSSLTKPAPTASKRKEEDSNLEQQPLIKKVKVLQNMIQQVKKVAEPKLRAGISAQPVASATPVNTTPSVPSVKELSVKREGDLSLESDRATTKKLKPSSLRTKGNSSKDPRLATMVPKKPVSPVSLDSVVDYITSLTQKPEHNQPVTNAQSLPNTQLSPTAQQLPDNSKPTVARSNITRLITSQPMISKNNLHSSIPLQSSSFKHASQRTDPRLVANQQAIAQSTQQAIAQSTKQAIAQPTQQATAQPTQQDISQSTQQAITQSTQQALTQSTQQAINRQAAHQQTVTQKNVTQPLLNFTSTEAASISVTRQQTSVKHTPTRPDQPLQIIPIVAKIPLKDPRLTAHTPDSPCSLPTPNHSPPPDMNTLHTLEQQRHVSSTTKLNKSPTLPPSVNPLARVLDQNKMASTTIQTASEQPPAMKLDKTPTSSPPSGNPLPPVSDQGNLAWDQLPMPALGALPPMDEVLNTLALLNKDQSGLGTMAPQQSISPLSPPSATVATTTQQQGTIKIGRKKAAREKKIEMKKKKAELKKKKAMDMAARRHNDAPKKLDNLDFDDLLREHEAITSAKATPFTQQQQQQKNQRQKQRQQSNSVPQNNLPKPPIVPKVFNRQQQQEPKRPFQQKKFVPTVVCKYYLQGTCRQGNNCTFKHEGEAPPPPTSRIVCQFYKTGSCTQGEDCKFSHDLKLEPCRFYHMQDCKQGEYCPYSHEPLNKERLERLRLLTGHCRFYLFKGFCNTGDDCLFLHSDATEEERKKVEATITACKYFHLTKNCRQGDNCFYLHNEATPEQVRSLSK